MEGSEEKDSTVLEELFRDNRESLGEVEGEGGDK